MLLKTRHLLGIVLLVDNTNLFVYQLQIRICFISITLGAVVPWVLAHTPADRIGERRGRDLFLRRDRGLHGRSVMRRDGSLREREGGTCATSCASQRGCECVNTQRAGCEGARMIAFLQLMAVSHRNMGVHRGERRTGRHNKRDHTQDKRTATGSKDNSVRPFELYACA